MDIQSLIQALEHLIETLHMMPDKGHDEGAMPGHDPLGGGMDDKGGVKMDMLSIKPKGPEMSQDAEPDMDDKGGGPDNEPDEDDKMLAMKRGLGKKY